MHKVWTLEACEVSSALFNKKNGKYNHETWDFLCLAEDRTRTSFAINMHSLNVKYTLTKCYRNIALIQYIVLEVASYRQNNLKPLRNVLELLSIKVYCVKHFKLKTERWHKARNSSLSMVKNKHTKQHVQNNFYSLLQIKTWACLWSCSHTDTSIGNPTDTA